MTTNRRTPKGQPPATAASDSARSGAKPARGKSGGRSAGRGSGGAPDWTVPVAVGEIPEGGRHFDLEPSTPVRDAIARTAGLASLSRLSAEFDLVRIGEDGVRVSGRVVADVGQNCIVTLEPIESEVDEEIDLVFSEEPERGPEAEEGGMAVHTLDQADPPEPLEDGVVDLGMVAIEFLLLGLDPYPRKPGVVFEPPAPPEPGEHPFAALAALKAKSEPKGS